MNITLEQKEGILQKVVGLESASLVTPLLTRHIFPWIEAQETNLEGFEGLQAREELKQIALDFYVESIKEMDPQESTTDILSRIQPNDLAAPIYLTGLAVEVVALYLRLEASTEIIAHQASENLDDELEQLLSED